MKLIIQIPCFNEAKYVAEVLQAVPATIPGIDTIETLVVDDGSTDETSQVAREAGADHVLRLPVNTGLARAFSSGLDQALKLGADIIVNTDADHQYPSQAIPTLVAPVVRGEADMVIGNRNPGTLEHFSVPKRLLQRLGSWVVRGLSGTTVPDATSGFRAFSREAAMRMNVVTEFTYTLETIIQAGKKQLSVSHVDVTVNPVRRPSRLFNGVTSYVLRSISTIVRVYAIYEPLRVFAVIGFVSLAAGTAIGARFLLDYLQEGGQGHIQSLILAAVLVLAGFQTILIGLVADLIGSSRRMLEDALLRIRHLELRKRE